MTWDKYELETRYSHSCPFLVVYSFPSLEKSTIGDDTEFSRISFCRSGIPSHAFRPGIYGIRGNGGVRSFYWERRWKGRGGGGGGWRVSRVRIVENGKECRRRAAGTAGFAVAAVAAAANFCRYWISRTINHPSAAISESIGLTFVSISGTDLWAEHVSLTGPMAIIAWSPSRWHLAIYIIFYSVQFMIE